MHYDHRSIGFVRNGDAGSKDLPIQALKQDSFFTRGIIKGKHFLGVSVLSDAARKRDKRTTPAVTTLYRG